MFEDLTNRSTMQWSRLNWCILLHIHVHKEEADKLDIISCDQLLINLLVVLIAVNLFLESSCECFIVFYRH